MLNALGAAVIAAGVLISAPALAADIPNLVGEWSGTAEAVVIGAGGYRRGKQTLKDAPFTDEHVFEYAIKGQDGRRF